MFKKFYQFFQNLGKRALAWLQRSYALLQKAFAHPMVQKAMMFVVVFLLSTTFCLAQGSTTAGVTGISDAASTFESYIEPIRHLLYIIAAVISLVGAFSVFTKLQNGDQDVKKTIMMTVGGCVAMIVMAEALPAFFLS